MPERAQASLPVPSGRPSSRLELELEEVQSSLELDTFQGSGNRARSTAGACSPEKPPFSRGPGAPREGRQDDSQPGAQAARRPGSTHIGKPRPLQSLAPAKTEPVHEQSDALACYGPRPRHPLGTISYFVRAYLKRRLLTDQLAREVALRKRAEDSRHAALASVGREVARLAEVHLDAGDADDAWQPLVRHLQVVAQAHADLKRAQSQQSRSQEARQLELSVAQERLQAAAQEVASLQRQRDAFVAKLDEQQRKATPVLKELRQSLSPPGRAGERAATQQDAELLQLQQIELHLQHLERATNAAKARLNESEARRREAADQVQEATLRIQRSQDRTMLSHDGAVGGVGAALVSLAEQASRLNLPGVEPLIRAMPGLETDLGCRQTAEQETRRMLDSLDRQAYQRGRLLLVGGTLALFITLAALIFL